MAKSATAIRKKHLGQGGRRKGFSASNEIEDMRLFDGIPGKDPSQEDGAVPAEGSVHPATERTDEAVEGR